jgi:hypothetical protein
LDAGVEAVGIRLGYILMHAELEGLICSGPLRGKQQTYAALPERVPEVGRSRTRDESLFELTLRYFSSHGPATIKDFQWWSSLTAADVTRGLDLVGDGLTSEAFDGVTYWFAGRAPTVQEVSPSVHLVQAYDEYIVGYTSSKYVLDISRTARSRSPDRVISNHVILLDSQVAGHWKRTIERKVVRIEAVLDSPFDQAKTQALRLAADRHADFLGLPAELNVST